MDNQHREIIGYRDLDQADIDLINRIKTAEGDLADLYHDVLGRTGTDKRWASIARTSFEQGFMALVRAVTRPGSPFDGARATES